MNEGISEGFGTAAPAHRPRVLVVDPDKRNLAVLVRRLGEAGYRVAAAASGASAITALQRHPVDLLLAELYMPEMSGAELTRAIRGEAAWRDLPVLLITAKSNPDGAVQAYQSGADDVILKPFHCEVLFARIDRRIARARSLKSLLDDNAALDARVVTRAIELGDMRERWQATEAERRRLAGLVGNKILPAAQPWGGGSLVGG